MIRINLLAADRRPEGGAAKAKGPSAPPGALQAYLFLVLFGGAALAGSGLLYWMKVSAIAKLDKDIAAAEKRQRDLEVIKKQVEEFERKKALLDAKVKLIEKLKSQQSGPVHMLDEISKALPEFVWLDQIGQTGQTITLDGQANSLTSVADLIANLQRCGWFPRVDLADSKEDKGIVTFKVTAEFLPPAAASSTPAAAPAPPADAKKS